MVHRSFNLHVDVFAQLQQPAYIPQRLSPYPLSCHKNSFFPFHFFLLLSFFDLLNVTLGQQPNRNLAAIKSSLTRFLGEQFLIRVRGFWLVCAWGRYSPLLNQDGYPCCTMQSSGVARI